MAETLSESIACWPCILWVLAAVVGAWCLCPLVGARWTREAMAGDAVSPAASTIAIEARSITRICTSGDSRRACSAQSMARNSCRQEKQRVFLLISGNLYHHPTERYITNV